jgi:hypothetical protein
MRFELLLDVMDRFLNLRDTDATCTNHPVPYGTALLGWRCPRHFVPAYDRTVPPGHFARGFIARILQLLNFRNSRVPVSAIRDRPLIPAQLTA